MRFLFCFYVPWLVSMAWLVSGKQNNQGQMREVLSWSTVKFRYPSVEAEKADINVGRYKPESCLPLGLGVHGKRLFVTLPRWKPGVPVTLATAPLGTGESSPLLDPYPNWSWHTLSDCNAITSVFRIWVDKCQRLWVLDSGKVDIAASVKSVCPPQILLFDLRTDRLLWRYKFPKAQIPQGSLLTNIVVDVEQDDCHNAYAYSGDVFRYGMFVYSLKENKSWRVDHPYFYPDPLASKFDLDGIKFSWTDGLFGMALSPGAAGKKTLYFHPLSSFREFSVPTSYLRNETRGGEEEDPFKKVGMPRLRSKGHSSGSAMDRYGILFYNLVSRSSVGCWNSNTGLHIPETQGVIASNNLTLSFPNDLRVDEEPNQGLWVLSNRLHKYLYTKLDPREINFRVLTVKVKDAVKGTPCDPQLPLPPTKAYKRQQNKCQDID